MKMSKGLITLATASALLVSSIGIANAIVETPEQINACVNASGVLQITEGEECLGNSTSISWNQQGVQGIPGVDGLDGTNGVDGAPGVDGIDGVSGYVQITQNAQAYVNTGGTFITSANCPVGQVPTGGGGYASGNAVLTDSAPTATGWVAKFRNDGGLGWISSAAYAVCIDA